MMIVFVDTSGLFAFLVQDDEMHEREKAVFSHLAHRNARLLTSSYVLLETISLLQRRVGLDSVKDFNETVFPLLEVIWVGETWHNRALERLMAESKRQLSITDCLSFEIMDEREIIEVFTFDRHFAERGFEILNPESPD
jgi:predicted nucleic acid-binding protein